MLKGPLIAFPGAIRRPFRVDIVGTGPRRSNNELLLYADVCLTIPTHATKRVG